MADEKVKPKGCSWIDGVGSTQAIDTAGEIVDLAGIDCSSLIGGALNWEHLAQLPAQIVGKVVEYKKIFSETDCETDRHKYYFSKVKGPYLYIMGRLFDDKKPSAVECAALFADDAEHPDEKPMVGFSVEGSKVDKKNIIVTKSIARKMTITNSNANKQCVAELVPNPDSKSSNDTDSIFKSEPSHTIELLEPLHKKEVPGSNIPPAHPPAAPSKAIKGAPGWSHAGGGNFQHPEHGVVSVVKQGPEFQVKHMGALAGVGGKKGVFGNSKEAGAHAGEYMRSLNQGKTFAPNMHQRPSPQMKSELKKGPDMSAPPSNPNPANAAAMQAGAMSGGTSMSQAFSNIKSGLGFGKKEKPKKSLEKGISVSLGGRGMGSGLPQESTDTKNKRGLFNPDVDKVRPTGMIMGGVGMSRSEKKGNLKKAMTAGSGMAAPGNLSGGAALAPESLDRKMKKADKLNPPVFNGVKGKDMKSGLPGIKEGLGTSHMGSHVRMAAARGPEKAAEHMSRAKEIAHKTLKDKSKWLARAEQEYKTWAKREQFENFMVKHMPSLAKGEIQAIGQILALRKSLRAEKKLAKMVVDQGQDSWVNKKEK
jgi:hypothetical protein